jgi:hypothetical protein
MSFHTFASALHLNLELSLGELLEIMLIEDKQLAQRYYEETYIQSVLFSEKKFRQEKQ